MSDAHPSDLGQELLDDFFTEADQHLLNIRQALLSLETSGAGVRNDDKIVGDLFLNFHSFKGISAIVGLEPAESLAHASEDLLRLLRDGEIEADEVLLKILNGATQKLEQIVSAFREKKSLPDYEAELIQIKRRCGEAANSSAITQPLSPVPHPGAPADPVLTEILRRPNVNVWKFTFSPSQALNAQKINVGLIREEISKVGNILKATPIVKGPGIINFEFLVALDQVVENIEGWKEKGVAIEAISATELPPVHPASAAAKSLTDEAHNPFLAPSHVVRVDLKRLDELLRTVGEMVIHRSRFEVQLAKLEQQTGAVDLRGVREVNRLMGRSLRQLREDIMGMRLIPVGEIFGRLPFVIRDLCRHSEKKVRLKLEGQDTAIDKYLIEKLKDPLLHMVRNSFSHGIETGAERAAHSKPEEGTIQLSATAAGDYITIKIKDDGRGINTKAILERAKQMGLEMPDVVDNEAILKILCAPGFSTKDKADTTSGRGVGMALVYSTIIELGGKLTLKTQPGKGTEFTMRLPLTVVIAETLIVSAAGQTCAIPQNSVRSIFHTSESEVQVVDGIEMVPYQDGVLPITRLAGLFNLSHRTEGTSCVLVVTSDRGSIGLMVEKVLGQKEVVVRAFRDPLIQVAGVSGATELGDGKPVLILDGAALTAAHVRPAEIFSETSL